MTDLTKTTAPLTDVHDMVVVHRAFRREFVLIPRLVRQVAAGDTGRAAVLAAHARLMLSGLHLHHTGEDELLWPKLLERAKPAQDLIHRMEAQHHTVETLIERLQAALVRWEAEARPAVTGEVASTFDALWTALAEHLDDEELHILPIAARHMSTAEWEALGKHGVAGMSASQLPLMFGMIMEDATPDEQAFMLAALPAPIRLVLRTWGARRYRRYVVAIRGVARAAR